MLQAQTTNVPSAPYSQIFPMGSAGAPRPGYWLVAKGGRGAIVTAPHLPAEGQGFLYYWLGKDPSSANGRLMDALPKLRIPVVAGQQYDSAKATASGSWTLPSPRKGLAGLLSGVDLVPFPIGGAALAGDAAAGDAAAAGSGAAAGAETGAGAGAAGGAAASAVKTAADAGVAASLLALIADPHLWIRIVEIVGGVLLLLMGLKALTGGAVDPVGAVRKVVR